MEEADTSNLTWTALGHFVPKPQTPGGGPRIRFVANYKRLNAVLERPTHNFQSALALIKSIPYSAKFFAKLDLAKAYLQVEIEKSSRPLTALLVEGFPVLQWK